MKYGKKVLTYKDIEEAKKLIGKQVVASDNLFTLSHIEDCKEPFISILYDVSDYMLPFATNKSSLRYQFIREVIEEEPKYRPFKDVNELIEHWCKDSNNIWKHREKTMPLIWVRNKNGNEKALITMFSEEDNAVYLNSDFGYVEFLYLLTDYEFLDGSPCGVEVEV